MKYLKLLFLASIFIVGYISCENVNNPHDFNSQNEPAYVEVSDTSSVLVEGQADTVGFQLPVTVPEDVNITFSISGTAVKGTDWTTSYGDITDTEGSATISYLDSTTTEDNFTLHLYFPRDNVNDSTKTLVFTLQSAVTTSGDSLNVGLGPNSKRKVFLIQDFDPVAPVTPGIYTYYRDGDFGLDTGTVVLTNPPTPTTVQDTDFPYMISDISGGVLNNPDYYPFTVSSDSVVVAPINFASKGVADFLTGSLQDTALTIQSFINRGDRTKPDSTIKLTIF